MVGLLEPGSIWRHYKGGVYTIVCTSLCSETLMKLVTYKDGYKTWTRPLSMWFDIVEGDTRRFTKIL
jgi:hypothetical protein